MSLFVNSILLFFTFSFCDLHFALASDDTKILVTIEGKVQSLREYYPNWTQLTKILVDGGQYLGFLKEDGSFQVQNLPAGSSYVFEVINADFEYEPVRVDINSKGKVRARKLNYIQTHSSQVQTVNYPLRFKMKGPANYFQKRETWRITDMLFSPMVLMMVLPMLLLFVLPKMVNMNDPDTQKEMANMQEQMPQPQMPDMAEKLTSWLGGDTRPKSRKK